MWMSNWLVSGKAERVVSSTRPELGAKPGLETEMWASEVHKQYKPQSWRRSPRRALWNPWMLAAWRNKQSQNRQLRKTEQSTREAQRTAQCWVQRWKCFLHDVKSQEDGAVRAERRGSGDLEKWSSRDCGFINQLGTVQIHHWAPSLRLLCIYVFTYLWNAKHWGPLSPTPLRVCAKLLQSCPTLGDPVDCSPPGSSVHGILQARILEWVAVPSSRGSSDPGLELGSLISPALAGGFFTTNNTWEVLCTYTLK